MVQSTGVITPPPPHKFDEDAFGRLSELADTVRTAFDQNAVDRGLHRLIAQPNRKNSGVRLGQRLFRDAQKYLKVHLRTEFVTDELETENRSLDRPTPLELFEIRQAVHTIRDGLMKLTARERLVFLTRMTSDTPQALGVGERRFRTLVSDARNRLWQQSRLEDAYSVVMDSLRNWRWETIDLLWPLSECLTLVN